MPSKKDRGSYVKITGLEILTPIVKQSELQSFQDSEHICPHCGQRAKRKFLLAENSELDPELENIGICLNKECLNGNYGIGNNQDPPLTEAELKSKRIEKRGAQEFEVMTLDMELEETRRFNLRRKRLEKIGTEFSRLACPICKQWQLKVLDDSAPGCFYAKCQNQQCSYKAFIDRT